MKVSGNKGKREIPSLRKVIGEVPHDRGLGIEGLGSHESEDTGKDITDTDPNHKTNNMLVHIKLNQNGLG